MSFAPAYAKAAVAQLTDHTDTDCAMFGASSDTSGELIAFESTCDLAGTNLDGNREIFQIDGLGAISQLTDTVDCASANASSNAAGDVIAFDSDCDFDGGNVDGSVEIFVFGAAGVEQLTDDQFCSSFVPSINAAGDLVAFDSDCDFVGENFERSSEIFQVDVAGVVAQLTDDGSMSGCGSFNASTNAAGNVIAFESDCDLTGANEDEISEIFRATIGAGSSVTVDQITVSGDDTCGSMLPSSDASGMVVAFESNCDYTGANADGGVEIFRISPSNTLTQVSGSATAECESIMPRVCDDASRIVYTSFCDPLGSNADGSFELFANSLTETVQLTDGDDCTSVAGSMAAGGTFASFVGDCDLTGGNADGSVELFQTSVDVCGACGGPISGNGAPERPTASDALFILQASVGLDLCPTCSCDVDANDLVAATDALLVLQAAVGQPVDLDCP